jgi:hypothetical protein
MNLMASAVAKGIPSSHFTAKQMIARINNNNFSL